MLLGVIADDFTGASDIANTLARGGMATTQFLGIPHTAAVACEAGVVALKTRSIPAADAVAQSLAALRWLQGQGCRQFFFKYCSTFDSTPEGNIGPVGEALAEALGARGVVACPAFPGAQRTVFQGHLFVGDRLLNESSLRHHPLNPMTDADLRRWLRRQTRDPVGLVPHATVSSGARAIEAALGESAARGERMVIVDAVDNRDLMAIGEACANAKLVTGGSGIALGLPANFARQGLLRGSAFRPKSINGPAAILAGSCSVRTRQQIERHLASHPGMAIDVDAVLEGRVSSAEVEEFFRRHRDEAAIAYSSAPPEIVAAAQKKHGAEKVAHAIESLLAQSASRLVRAGIRRLVVAGGETSGAVVTGLGLQTLEVGPEIDTGVPVLYSGELALALKSGNFGAEDFFEKALQLMQR